MHPLGRKRLAIMRLAALAVGLNILSTEYVLADPASLVEWWTLDEPIVSGQVTEGEDALVAVGPTPPVRVPGVWANALNLPQGTMIQYGGKDWLSDADGITISFWARIDIASAPDTGNVGLFELRFDDGGRLELSASPLNSIQLNVFSADQADPRGSTIAAPASPLAWHLYSLLVPSRASGAKATLLIDGQFAGFGPNVPGLSGARWLSNTTFGTNSGDSISLDDVRIYVGLLDPAEVALLYRVGLDAGQLSSQPISSLLKAWSNFVGNSNGGSQEVDRLLASALASQSLADLPRENTAGWLDALSKADQLLSASQRNATASRLDSSARAAGLAALTPTEILAINRVFVEFGENVRARSLTADWLHASEQHTKTGPDQCVKIVGYLAQAQGVQAGAAREKFRAWLEQSLLAPSSARVFGAARWAEVVRLWSWDWPQQTRQTWAGALRSTFAGDGFLELGDATVALAAALTKLGDPSAPELLLGWIKAGGRPVSGLREFAEVATTLVKAGPSASPALRELWHQAVAAAGDSPGGSLQADLALWMRMATACLSALTDAERADVKNWLLGAARSMAPAARNSGFLDSFLRLFGPPDAPQIRGLFDDWWAGGRLLSETGQMDAPAACEVLGWFTRIGGDGPNKWEDLPGIRRQLAHRLVELSLPGSTAAPDELIDRLSEAAVGLMPDIEATDRKAFANQIASRFSDADFLHRSPSGRALRLAGFGDRFGLDRASNVASWVNARPDFKPRDATELGALIGAFSNSEYKHGEVKARLAALAEPFALASNVPVENWMEWTLTIGESIPTDRRDTLFTVLRARFRAKMDQGTYQQADGVNQALTVLRRIDEGRARELAEGWFARQGPHMEWAMGFNASLNILSMAAQSRSCATPFERLAQLELLGTSRTWDQPGRFPVALDARDVWRGLTANLSAVARKKGFKSYLRALAGDAAAAPPSQLTAAEWVKWADLAATNARRDPRTLAAATLRYLDAADALEARQTEESLRYALVQKAGLLLYSPIIGWREAAVLDLWGMPLCYSAAGRGPLSEDQAGMVERLLTLSERFGEVGPGISAAFLKLQISEPGSPTEERSTRILCRNLSLAGRWDALSYYLAGADDGYRGWVNFRWATFGMSERGIEREDRIESWMRESGVSPRVARLRSTASLTDAQKIEANWLASYTNELSVDQRLERSLWGTARAQSGRTR